MSFPFSNFKITQEFANDPQYYSQFGFDGHEGLDLVPKDGDWNIFSVEDGIVVRDYDSLRNNYGITAVIWNEKTRRGWWYCHLEKNYVGIGQRIKKGDLIGVMGGTGNVTAPHLHLGLRETDAKGYAINLDNGFKGFIDPLPFLEGKTKCQELKESMQRLLDEFNC